MKRRKWWQTLILYSLVIFWCFVVLFPFYWLITTSVKRPLDVSRGPRYLPFIDFQPVQRGDQRLGEVVLDDLLLLSARNAVGSQFVILLVLVGVLLAGRAARSAIG